MGYKALVLTWGSPSAVGACLGREEGTLEPTFAQSSESLKGSIDLGAAPEAATMGGAERIPPPPGSEPCCQESLYIPTSSHALLQCKSEHRSETHGGKPKRKTQSPADSFPAAPASPPALWVSLGQTMLSGTHRPGLVRPNYLSFSLQRTACWGPCPCSHRVAASSLLALGSYFYILATHLLPSIYMCCKFLFLNPGLSCYFLFCKF